MTDAARASVVVLPFVDARIALTGAGDVEALQVHVASSDDILHLAELVPVLRQRLGMDDALSDAAMLASLKTIVACASPRERWRAAFNSTLGHWLALKGSDLNTTLNTLVALLPKPRM